MFTCAINRHGNKISGDDVIWQRLSEGGVINIPETRGLDFSVKNRIIEDVLTFTITNVNIRSNLCIAQYLMEM